MMLKEVQDYLPVSVLCVSDSVNMPVVSRYNVYLNITVIITTFICSALFLRQVQSALTKDNVKPVKFSLLIVQTTDSLFFTERHIMTG